MTMLRAPDAATLARDGGVVFVAAQRRLVGTDRDAVGIGHVTARGLLDETYAPKGRVLVQFPDEGEGELRGVLVFASKVKPGRGYVLLNTGRSLHLLRVFL